MRTDLLGLSAAVAQTQLGDTALLAIADVLCPRGSDRVVRRRAVDRCRPSNCYKERTRCPGVAPFDFPDRRDSAESEPCTGCPHRYRPYMPVRCCMLRHSAPLR